MATAGPESAFPINLEIAGKEIFELVSASDLSELTSAKVRVHLKTKFGVDFDAYKKKINDLTRNAIEQMEKEKNKKKNNSSSKDDSDDSDSDDDGKADNDDEEENGTRNDEADSSDSDSDPGILSTDRKFKGKKTKNASDSHEYADMVSNIKTSRRAAASKAKDSIKKSAGFIPGGSKKSKKRGAEEDTGPKIEGKVGRQTKLVYCTPLLQEITGKAYMKRCDVVKVMWDYIKANNLQDAKNKSIVRCDSKLEAITKRKTFKGFGMTKHLVNHVLMPKDMGPEYEAEAQEALSEMIVDYQRRVREARDDGEPDEKKVKTEDEEEKEEKVKEEEAEESDDEQESDSDSD